MSTTVDGRDAKHDVKDLGARANAARLRIEWADASMPVLRQIRERFEKEKPLAGVRLSACLHVTTRDGEPRAHARRPAAPTSCSAPPTPSRPRTTSPPRSSPTTAISVYAIKGEDHATYYDHIRAALAHRPEHDDGRRRRPRLLAALPRARQGRRRRSGRPRRGRRASRRPSARRSSTGSSAAPRRRRRASSA